MYNVADPEGVSKGLPPPPPSSHDFLLLFLWSLAVVGLQTVLLGAVQRRGQLSVMGGGGHGIHLIIRLDAKVSETGK